MKKLIIKYDDKMTAEDALFFVRSVIHGGRISETAKGKQFCFVSTWDNQAEVFADLTRKGSDVFTVVKL